MNGEYGFSSLIVYRFACVCVFCRHCFFRSFDCAYTEEDFKEKKAKIANKSDFGGGSKKKMWFVYKNCSAALLALLHMHCL